MNTTKTNNTTSKDPHPSSIFKTFHIHTTIKAAREHWDIFGLPKHDVFRILNGMEAEGKTLVKAEGCDNFDEKEGCQGHV